MDPARPAGQGCALLLKRSPSRIPDAPLPGWRAQAAGSGTGRRADGTQVALFVPRPAQAAAD
jgi:hypothetical protein